MNNNIIAGQTLPLNVLHFSSIVYYYHVAYTHNVYNVCLGEWISPTVAGNRLPPIDEFTLTSVTNNTAVLFGGSTNYGSSDKAYMIRCSKASVVS